MNESFRVLNTVIASGLPLWIKWINFGIYAAALGALLYKPVTNGLKGRAQNILDALNRASREKAEAEAKAKEIETRLSKLDSEIAEIKVQAERDAQAEYDRIVRAANDDAERLRKLTKMEIEGAAKAARLELKEFAAAKAVELAESMIRREINDADRASLVTRYTEQLERIN
jgi:F-type H+-transporting ATPase subunit b